MPCAWPRRPRAARPRARPSCAAPGRPGPARLWRAAATRGRGPGPPCAARGPRAWARACRLRGAGGYCWLAVWSIRDDRRCSCRFPTHTDCTRQGRGHGRVAVECARRGKGCWEVEPHKAGGSRRACTGKGARLACARWPTDRRQRRPPPRRPRCLLAWPLRRRGAQVSQAAERTHNTPVQ